MLRDECERSEHEELGFLHGHQATPRPADCHSTEAMLLHLPPRGRLQVTGPVDFVAQYHNGPAGWLLRQRLHWVRDALPIGCDAILEIGYGSGIFFYELARHARTVVGVDVHNYGSSVRRRCALDGIDVMPAQASGTALPFADGSFDAVVMVSTLEFVPDPAACLRESLRVVRDGGRVIAVIPRMHAWADAVWRVISGADPESEFQGGRERVAHALADASLPATHHPRPRPLPNAIAPYDLIVLTARGDRGDADLGHEVVDGVAADEHVDSGRFVHAEVGHRYREHDSPALARREMHSSESP
jgi:SAM-dependent methyltransferase